MNGNKLDAQSIAKGRKLVYEGARRWTRRDHPYRRDLSFNGREEHVGIPPRMSPGDILQFAHERKQYLRNEAN
jgi:hypothetical protein